MKELYITGAGVSSASGIPTFRGSDGFWTVGSVNYTPQEMATRYMYENYPDQFLLWYFKRFIAYKDAKPNFVHKWLSNKNLITQNIDGLDAKAGNKNYISIHGRLDKVITYQDEMEYQIPIDANWNEIDPSHDDNKLISSLFDKFKILETNNFKPKIKSSLKPFVLLFDEMYTEIYRFSEAEEWMNAAKKMIFIGTSFSVNITSIALRIGMSNNIPIEIVDPKPMKLNYPNIKYFEMSGEEYCKLKEDL